MTNVYIYTTALALPPRSYVLVVDISIAAQRCMLVEWLCLRMHRELPRVALCYKIRHCCV